MLVKAKQNPFVTSPAHLSLIVKQYLYKFLELCVVLCLIYENCISFIHMHLFFKGLVVSCHIQSLQFSLGRGSNMAHCKHMQVLVTKAV